MRKKHANKIRQEVKKVYAEIAHDFDSTRQKQWQEFEYFMEYVDNHAKVLDLGCGNGRLFSLLKEKSVDYIGTDQSKALLNKAKESHPMAEFRLGELTDIELESDKFDVLFCIAAFHHLPGKKLRRESISEMNRVLKKEGILILTVWNLFQWKYCLNIFKAVLSFVFYLTMKYAWNDLWVEWKNHKRKRYYHAFLPSELKTYFEKRYWKIEELYFVRKGVRVKFWRSFNVALIARKINSND